MPGGGINIDPIVDTGSTIQQGDKQNIEIGKSAGVKLLKGLGAQLIIQRQNLTDVRYNDNYAKFNDGGNENVLQYFPSI